MSQSNISDASNRIILLAGRRRSLVVPDIKPGQLLKFKPRLFLDYIHPLQYRKITERANNVFCIKRIKGKLKIDDLIVFVKYVSINYAESTDIYMKFVYPDGIVTNIKIPNDRNLWWYFSKCN